MPRSQVYPCIFQGSVWTLEKKFRTCLGHTQTEDIVLLPLLCKLALGEPNLHLPTLFMKEFANLCPTFMHNLHMVWYRVHKFIKYSAPVCIACVGI